MITMEIDNRSRRVIINFKKMDRRLRKCVRRGNILNAGYLEKKLKSGILNPPKSGVKYPSLPNRSSAPGEYPANQTGKLMSSVTTQQQGLNFLIGYTVDYGRFLELGTSKRIAPRPAIQTAINTSVAAMKYNYERELNHNLGK